MQNKKEEGYSLLEVMISLIIAGILVMAFGRLIYAVKYSNKSNEQYFKVINWGQSLMEYTRQQELSEMIGQYSPKEIINPKDLNQVYKLLEDDLVNNVMTLIKVNRVYDDIELYRLTIEIRWQTKMKDRGYKLITYVYEK